jgi:ABC-type glycerol-3-phosphate transport system substrate-binding protein
MTDQSPTFSRRSTLIAAIAGAGLGVAGTETVHRLRDGGDRSAAEGEKLGGNGEDLIIYGADNAGARSNSVTTWLEGPITRKHETKFTYNSLVGDSTQQFDSVQTLYTNGAKFDVTVVDAENLPQMAAAQQVAEFATLDHRSLIDAVGYFDGVSKRCLYREKVYGLPLNADAPVLAVNTTMLNSSGLAYLDKLKSLTGADFWKAALAMVQQSTGASGTRRIAVANGQNEGFTVLLVELMAAVPGSELKSGATRAPAQELVNPMLDAVRDIGFPVDTFALTSNGDEATAKNDLQNGRTVAARLWPAFCYDLNVSRSGAEEDTPVYQVVPIPQGVLGGQIMTVSRNSEHRATAQALVTYLAGSTSQLQLYHNGGYVPAIGQLYADRQIYNRQNPATGGLYGLTAKWIDQCFRRPLLENYAAWSPEFREDARRILLQ